MIHRIIALMFLATSINGVSAMNDISEDTSSHTSDVSSISSNSDIGSVDNASSLRLSRSREKSPTRERYGIYVVDKSYISLTKDDISDKENFASIEIPLSV